MWGEKCQLQCPAAVGAMPIIKTTSQYKLTFTSIFINTMYSTDLAYNAVLVMMYNNSTI